MKKILLICLGLLPFFYTPQSFAQNGHIHTNENTKKGDIYYCPMHPNYTSSKPGTCPICFMDLVLREDKNEEHKNEEKDEKPIYSVNISSEMMKGLKVSLWNVSYKKFELNLNLPGQVVRDEELYKKISEYKTLAKIRKETSSKSNYLDEVINSSILRLKQYGITDEELDEIIDNDYEGLLLSAKKMWVYLYLNEKDLNNVYPGMLVEIKTQAYKGEVFWGKIKSIDDFVSSSRNLKVRVEVENKANKLKPDMYVEGNIKISFKDALVIPVDSYIESGNMDMVYVENESNAFEMRMITVGASNDRYSQVLNGLKAGDKIVASPSFLIDSETRLKTGMGSNEHSGHSGH